MHTLSGRDSHMCGVGAVSGYWSFAYNCCPLLCCLLVAMYYRRSFWVCIKPTLSGRDSYISGLGSSQSRRTADTNDTYMGGEFVAVAKSKSACVDLWFCLILHVTSLESACYDSEFCTYQGRSIDGIEVQQQLLQSKAQYWLLITWLDPKSRLQLWRPSLPWQGHDNSHEKGTLLLYYIASVVQLACLS